MRLNFSLENKLDDRINLTPCRCAVVTVNIQLLLINLSCGMSMLLWCCFVVLFLFRAAARPDKCSTSSSVKVEADGDY